MQRAITEALTTDSFDVVQIESTELWAFDVRAPGSSHVVVLDTHNVFAELLTRLTKSQRRWIDRLYWQIETAKFVREERRIWASVDGCVLTSEREAVVVRASPGARAAAVVPNAVDLDYLQPSADPVDPWEIVFVGLMSYRPNQDAVQWFTREILPLIVQDRPEVMFTVVGKEPPASLLELAGPHVRFTGMVPDTRPYLSRAAVVVAPLRTGSGTRLKILEALAMGKGVVSTSIGCEGLEVTDGRELLVADDAAVFAEAVGRLVDHPHEASELGRRGRTLVERSYGWPAATLLLEEFYARLLAER